MSSFAFVSTLISDASIPVRGIQSELELKLIEIAEEWRSQSNREEHC